MRQNGQIFTNNKDHLSTAQRSHFYFVDNFMRCLCLEKAYPCLFFLGELLLELLRQIDEASNAGLYFAALYSALTIPDNCAALWAQDGKTDGKKYAAWFDQWVAPKYAGALGTTVTGDVCYYYRCAMLHQGRSHHPKMPYSRIIFLEPNSRFSAHNNIMNDALNIDVQAFVRDITSSARDWWTAHASEAVVEKNWEQSTRRHAEGIAPYIVGIPVIG